MRCRGSAPVDRCAEARPDTVLRQQTGTQSLANDQELGPISAAAGLIESACSSALLNAGRSSGLRLVTSLPSITTSSSVHSAPALRKSCCRLGQLVRCLALAMPASIRVQGP